MQARIGVFGDLPSDIIEHFAHGRTAQQIAGELEIVLKAQVHGWKSQPGNIAAWVWEENGRECRVRRLPNKIAVEKPREVNTCADDDHVSRGGKRIRDSVGGSADGMGDGGIPSSDFGGLFLFRPC